jgi:hypothetical protein
MAIRTTLKDVFERNQYDLETSIKKSRSWFDTQVTLLSKQNITPKRILGENPDQMVSTIVPGNLYMYAYDPKFKAELPYYDRFPLVFPFRALPDGFIGLNMHYLPYKIRIALLDQLLIFKSNNRLDHTTRLKYSWGAINGASSFSAAIPCVKQYLYGHVRSKFRQINSEDWATAMLLPVEKFVGAPKEMVWSDSKRTIRKA